MTDPADTNASRQPSLRRLGHIALAAVIAGAAVGYFVGINDGVTPHTPVPLPKTGHAQATHTDLPQAVSYRQMAATNLGPNAAWISRLPEPTSDPAVLFATLPVDEQDRQASVEARAQRRAFSGAPPVIPHAIDQTSAASCLACHGEGLKVGTVVAPRMSHESYANCTQCHVEMTNRALPPIVALRVGANRFDGLATPGPGERAWPGAPPTVPHTTWMRENCMSCHGELAQHGLRTSHPWRVNCNQCHTPSATLDQVQTSPWAAPSFLQRSTKNP